jgi:peptide/nickel transport system substrate-binding protein
MRKHIILFIAVLFLFTFAIGGCGEDSAVTSLTSTTTSSAAPTSTTATATPTSTATTEPSQARYGGTLRVAEVSGVTNFGYPPLMRGAQNQRTASPAIERLFSFDVDGQVQPWLAQNYQADIANKSITFTLNKGVKFHDGTDFDAEAVRWNLNQCMSTKLAGTEKFLTIDVVDDYTVRINLSQWDNTVLGSLASIPGMMISPAAYDKNGEEWCMSNPVGTGPFSFVSFEQDVNAIYEKWDNYWKVGRPYLDGVEFNFIKDNLTREMAFKADEQDVIVTTDVTTASNLRAEGYLLLEGKQQSGIGAVFSSSNPDSPFYDLKVRQAVAYAIDREAIVDMILHNVLKVTNQLTYEGHWGYNPSVVGYPYNPERAKQLLSETAFANGFDTEMTYISTPMYDQVYTAVQGYLKELNINLELKPNLPPKLGQIRDTGWDGLTFTGGGNSPDLVLWLVNRYTHFAGSTYASMLQPEDYVAAVDSAITAADFASKQQYCQEAMKLMFDKYCLVLTISSTADFCGTQARVHNIGLCQTSADTSFWPFQDIWLEY